MSGFIHRSVFILASSALAAWCAFILLANFYNPPPFGAWEILIAVAALLIPIVFAHQLVRAPKPISIFIVFLIALLLRLAFILLMPNQPEPTSDFGTMYEMALSIAGGNISDINTSPYFQTWSYQIPFTLFESLIISVTGQSLIAIKIVNAILSSILAALLVAIGSRWLGNKEGLTAGLVMAFWPENIATVSVLTNQHLATTLLYGGFLVLIAGHGTLKSAAGTGFLLSASNLARPLGPITMLVATLSELWNKSAPVAQRIRRCSLILVAFLITHVATVSVGEALGIRTNWYQNENTAIKFALGLNTQSHGAWSQEDIDLIQPYVEGGSERAKALILQRISEPLDLAGLMAVKATRMWGGGGRSPSFVAWSGVSDGILRDMQIASQWIYMVLSALGLVAALSLSCRKYSPNRGRTTVLMGSLIAAYFVIHLVIESNSKYRLDMMPVLVLLGGAALAWTSDQCSHLLDGIRVKPGRT